MTEPADELKAIEGRYERRRRGADSALYDPMDPYVLRVRQEKERGVIRCLRHAGLLPVAGKRVLEVGCGGGANLLDLVRLGFRPEDLVGNELRPDRLEEARSRLPGGVTLVPGDAAALDAADESFDIVIQSTVFTSILDDEFQERLAARMWSLARPGGGVLWYDFTWDNPRNPDVRGVPIRRIRSLFPRAAIRAWPVTLAPPLGRRVCRTVPLLYPLLYALPPLRTHLLCWIGKAAGRTAEPPRS